MKRTVIWLCAILVVLVAGIGVIAAETRGWHGWRGHRFAGFGPAAYVVHKLDLNTSQREAIKSIWQVERPTVARLVHELAAESRELNTARAEGNTLQTDWRNDQCFAYSKLRFPSRHSCWP